MILLNVYANPEKLLEKFAGRSQPYDHNIAGLADAIHQWAHSKGFYEGDTCPMERTCKHASGSILSALMLITTELAEAAEAVRKDDRANFAEELADTMIRLLDLCAAEGINIEAHIMDKMRKNMKRPQKHGKKF